MTDPRSPGADRRAPHLDAEQARLALEASRMGTWRWSMATNEVVWDEALEALYGLPPGGFDRRYETYLSLIHPDDRETSVATIQASIAGGGEHRVEHRVLWPDGSVHWVEGWGRVTRNADGEVDGLIGVSVDITERKRAEARLREQDAWIRRLQGITAAISGSASVAEIAQVVIAQAVAATGAGGGVLALIDQSESVLEIVGESGFRRGGLDAWRRFPLDAELPLAAVARTGAPIWGATASSLAERYRSFGAVSNDGGFGVSGTVTIVPFVTQDGPIGAIGLRFNNDVVVSLDEQEFLLALAGQSAQAFDRARLYESERDARQAAEEAESRLAFLSRVSEVLSGTLDADEALRRLADLVVPRIAEWCSVEAIEPDGSLRNVAVAHSDPVRAEWARESRRRFPPSPDGIGYVIETGHSVFVPEVDEAGLVAVAQNQKHLEAIQTLGLASVMIVPIKRGTDVVGAISMFTTGQRERFDEDDLVFAEEIARRAAVALENARLHEAERRARHGAELAVEWLARLQSVTSSLSTALTATEVADVIVREGVAALGADAGSVWMLEADDRLHPLAWRGYPDDLAGSSVPADGGPLGDAIAAREIVSVASPEEMLARWPQLAAMRERVGDVATAATPLLLDERVLGVFYVAFRTEHTFEALERAFLTTLARQCAQAFERARLYELERARVDAEREARATAEVARMRLQQLQAITEAGLAHVALDDALERMLAALRAAIGSDTAAILLVGQALDDDLTVRAVLGVEGRGLPNMHASPDGAILSRVVRHGESVVIDDAAEIDIPPHVPGELASLVAVPMRASGRVVGVLHAGSRVRRPFTNDDLELLHLAAERVALAVDRAQLFEREHRIAETLQRSLLPERLPELPGVQLAARYLPGSTDVQVGGDWYEVVPLTGGRLSAAVGDVVGRGIRAAAAMGQFRNAMRALALEGLSPARLLDRLSELSIGLGREFATATTLELDPLTGVVSYSSAGHPPPLVLPPDGEPWFLDGGRSTPLGVEPGTAYPEAVAQLTPGTTVLVYTDGLIERRGETLEDGLARLRLAPGGETDPERLVDSVIDALTGEHREDDVALLAIRYVMAPTRFELRLPSEARSVARFRAESRVWLEETGVASRDIEDLILAISEACSNAVEHAGAEGADVALAAEFRDQDVIVTVQDSGRWQPPHLRFERGRGFRILRALMNDVTVSRRGDGTEVRMRRRLAERVPAS
ncbi:MAG: GAF domain-containing protein [Actinomycetota bacterium]